MAEFDIRNLEDAESTENGFKFRTDAGSGPSAFDIRDLEDVETKQRPAPHSGDYKLPFRDKFDKSGAPQEWFTQGEGWFLQAIWNQLDWIPFAKYAREEDRAEWGQLTGEEKGTALAWETVGAGLWVFGGQIIRGAGKLVGLGAKGIAKGYRGLKPLVKFKPIEDIGTWTAENYHAVTSKYLRKDLKWARNGLSEEEAGAVTKALQGENWHLKDTVIRNLGNTSKQFQSMIENVSGVPYAEFKLTNSTLRSLADFAPDQVRKRHLLDEFTAAVKKKQVVGGKVSDPLHLGAIYKAQAKRFFGAGAKHKTLDTATSQELWNFTKNLLNSPNAVTEVGKLLRPGGFRYFNVIRRAYGKGEELFGTHSGIYKPIKKAFGHTNEYTGYKILEFQKMLTQRGFMKKGKTGAFSRTKYFSNEVGKWAHWKMSKVDDLTGIIAKSTDPVEQAVLQRQLAGLNSRIPKDVDLNAVNKLVETTYSFFDKTYGERMAWKIGDMLDKAGMNSMGRALSEKMKNDLYSRLRFTMSTSGSLNYTKRVNGMKAVFGDVQGMLKNMKVAPATSWFADRGAATFRQGKKLANGEFEQVHWLDDFAERFQFTKDGDFFPYLENYLPRLYQGEVNATGKIFGKLGGKQRAFYTQPRKSAEALDERLGLEQLIHSRVRAQAKEMFLYDELSKVAEFTKNLPEGWRNFTEQYLARILNIPARADEWVAKWITDPTLGVLERALGKDGVWDGRRVMRLSQNINDITYMGFLGLKPFSAMRNLFQPLILVPADLGGTKNLVHLVKGYQKGLVDPKGRAYLNSIGIITDYAPELRRVPRIFKTRPTVGSIPLPMREEIRDVMMWMFQGSDKWNRYVTGGAAMSKWETALTKSGLGKVAPDKFLNPGAQTKTVIDRFLQQSGVNGRHSWVKAELESSIKSGRLSEAKATFIKDVVSDTQFLYGGLDAPLWSHVGGGITRNAAIFQSWWLNYAGLMEKWLVTGEKGERLSRMMGWVLPQAIAYETMKQMWGKQTAARSTFFGPFPTSDTFLGIPPSWEPVGQVLKVANTMANVAMGADEPAEIGKQIKALAWKSFSFVPAGLQLKQMIRGAEKEGAKGVAKSIIRWSPPKPE